MNKLYFLIFLCAISLNGYSQIVDIPDANFKDALVNTFCVDTDGDGIGDIDADTNNDGEIQVSEAESVFGLNLSYSTNNIISLDGIESFINLELLACWSNELTSLNVTQNTNLEVLICWGNQLSNLDVTQNTNLILLSCGVNQLTSLDVTQNTNLEELYCFDNQLSSLNIENGNNDNMPVMFAYQNPNLTCIQVDDETAIYPVCDGGLGWCKDSAATYSEECILRVVDFENTEISLYPNPVQNSLSIKSDVLFDTVQIYSFGGQLIKSVQGSEIDVSNLSSRMYFAVLSRDGQSLTKKFVKL